MSDDTVEITEKEALEIFAGAVLSTILIDALKSALKVAAEKLKRQESDLNELRIWVKDLAQANGKSAKLLEEQVAMNKALLDELETVREERNKLASELTIADLSDELLRKRLGQQQQNYEKEAFFTGQEPPNVDRMRKFSLKLEDYREPFREID